VGDAVPDFAEKVASPFAPPTGFLAWGEHATAAASVGVVA
jgi:hypothetical protein